MADLADSVGFWKGEDTRRMSQLAQTETTFLPLARRVYPSTPDLASNLAPEKRVGSVLVWAEQPNLVRNDSNIGNYAYDYCYQNRPFYRFQAIVTTRLDIAALSSQAAPAPSATRFE